jgi:hypothetical protein
LAEFEEIFGKFPELILLLDFVASTDLRNIRDGRDVASSVATSNNRM